MICDKIMVNKKSYVYTLMGTDGADMHASYMRETDQQGTLSNRDTSDG